MVDPSLSFDGGALLAGIGGAGKPDDFILTFLLTETVGAGMFGEPFWRKGRAKIAQCLVKHVTSGGKLDESIGK
jgi:hypothetical protein